LRQEGDDFFVIDEKGLYLGICRQREVLAQPAPPPFNTGGP
jgi:hypothetical protein